MWRRLATCAAVLVGAHGCTIVFPFAAPDEGGSGDGDADADACGDCGLCRCVFGDAHEVWMATAGRPGDDRDCCTQIQGDFDEGARSDWYVFPLFQGEHLSLNACSTSLDLHYEVHFYADTSGASAQEIDRVRVDGRNCAGDTLTYDATSDGDHAIQVADIAGVPGEYSIHLAFY